MYLIYNKTNPEESQIVTDIALAVIKDSDNVEIHGDSGRGKIIEKAANIKAQNLNEAIMQTLVAARVVSK